MFQNLDGLKHGSYLITLELTLSSSFCHNENNSILQIPPAKYLVYHEKQSFLVSLCLVLKIIKRKYFQVFSFINQHKVNFLCDLNNCAKGEKLFLNFHSSLHENLKDFSFKKKPYTKNYYLHLSIRNTQRSGHNKASILKQRA